MQNKLHSLFRLLFAVLFMLGHKVEMNIISALRNPNAIISAA